MFQDGSDGVPIDSPRTLSFQTGAHPSPISPAVGTHCEQSILDPANRRRGPRLPQEEAEAAACSSSVLRRASEPGDYNTGTAETDPATFPRDVWPPADRSWRSPRGKGALRRPRDTWHRPSGIGHQALRTLGRVEFHEATLRSHQFASERFHVLLNSLFKVLFNFPSRYLSAIGLVSVFSLRWSLPPALGCIPKQPDSKDAWRHVGPRLD